MPSYIHLIKLLATIGIIRKAINQITEQPPKQSLVLAKKLVKKIEVQPTHYLKDRAGDTITANCPD